MIHNKQWRLNDGFQDLKYRYNLPGFSFFFTYNYILLCVCMVNLESSSDNTPKEARCLLAPIFSVVLRVKSVYLHVYTIQWEYNNTKSQVTKSIFIISFNPFTKRSHLLKIKENESNPCSRKTQKENELIFNITTKADSVLAEESKKCMSLHWQYLWPEVLCFQVVHLSVPFSWTPYLRNTLREFLHICHSKFTLTQI